MPYKVFFCAPSGRSELAYSCTSRDGKSGCNGRDYHRAEMRVFSGTPDEARALFDAPGRSELYPVKCDGCDYHFSDDDHRSRGLTRIFVRQDTGEEVELGGAPIGACWDADWYHDWRTGPDGRSLVVKTPGGEWFIDSEASNCTRKGDDSHRCWVRHGCPEDGTLHVDKKGETCAAGAGSIMCGGYHGFLHNGQLTDG